MVVRPVTISRAKMTGPLSQTNVYPVIYVFIYLAYMCIYTHIYTYHQLTVSETVNQL